MAATNLLTASARTPAGTLRQEILVGGRHRVVTDLPAAAGGTDLGPSAHELFVAALAGCISSTLAVYARTKGWELGEIVTDVDYDRGTTPRRCRIVIHVGSVLTPEQRARLEKVAAACPLRRSLEAGFEFHEELRSREREAA